MLLHIIIKFQVHWTINNSSDSLNRTLPLSGKIQRAVVDGLLSGSDATSGLLCSSGKCALLFAV